MDFLGLTTLTVIDDALKLIKQTNGVDARLATIPLDDAKTYEQVFHRALTSGVFQFESGGMRDVLRRYKPTTVDDLTALNALYRPGPIEGGMIDDFIERKWGRRAVEYMLPELEPHPARDARRHRLPGTGDADLERRRRLLARRGRSAAPRDGQEERRRRWPSSGSRFMAGAAENKHPKDKAGELFDLMEQFAGYGFNKSHSAAYALLAYHTAWLKTHYPVEFMAALLTSETSKPENVVKYISECREMNIPVVPPNVQISDANFTPVNTEAGEAIGFGLAAIKNVGAQRDRVDHRRARGVAGRREAGLREPVGVLREVDLRLLNKRVLESLIKAGAMDAFGAAPRSCRAR